jgi:pimeloyl-ACP methyl ester carboxylesterase
MGASARDRFAPPAPVLSLLESRAVFELGAAVAASPLLRMLGRGDRHPVLILPGFLAGDPSTAPLRSVLRSQGYWTHGWQLGRNLGPTPDVVDGLVARLSSLHERHERPVSVVGWSLGGIYARRLARRSPHMVRQVITLGSPFRIQELGGRSAVSAFYDRLRPAHAVGLEQVAIDDHEVPAEIPVTAVYTRTDGVVRWWQCIEQVGDRRENIEVRGSHSGLGFNPAVIYAISDRLSQPAGEWRPFRPPPGSGALFPPPADFRPDVADGEPTGRGDGPDRADRDGRVNSRTGRVNAR